MKKLVVGNNSSSALAVEIIYAGKVLRSVLENANPETYTNIARYVRTSGVVIPKGEEAVVKCEDGRYWDVKRNEMYTWNVKETREAIFTYIPAVQVIKHDDKVVLEAGQDWGIVVDGHYMDKIVLTGRDRIKLAHKLMSTRSGEALHTSIGSIASHRCKVSVELNYTTGKKTVYTFK